MDAGEQDRSSEDPTLITKQRFTPLSLSLLFLYGTRVDPEGFFPQVRRKECTSHLEKHFTRSENMVNRLFQRAGAVKEVPGNLFTTEFWHLPIPSFYWLLKRMSKAHMPIRTA